MTNVELIEQRAEKIRKDWESNPRWEGIQRDYTAEDVARLQGSFVEDQTVAKMGSDRLWHLLTTRTTSMPSAP